MLDKPPTNAWTNYLLQPELILPAASAAALWLIGLGGRVKALETKADSQEQTLRDMNGKLDRLIEKLIPE